MRCRKTMLLLYTIGIYSFFLASCEKAIDLYYGGPKGLVVETLQSAPDKLDSSIYQYYNFNTEIGNWYEKSTCCDWSGMIDKNIKRAGKGSLKVELLKNDITYGHRTELGTKPGSHGRDGWYAYSLYFPSPYISDDVEECIVQWHAQPDLGELHGSPPLFLGVLKNRYILDMRTDTSKVTIQGNWTFNRLDLGPVDQDKWTDWVFHIKWAYDNTGILEIWKDKIKWVSRIKMPNSYNDNTFPYFKIGIYRYGWAAFPNNPINKRTIYVDEVKIADENGSLEKMSSVIN